MTRTKISIGATEIVAAAATGPQRMPCSVILPYFLIFRDVGKTAIGKSLHLGLDQHGALIVSYVMFNLPFAIWLLVSFFQDIT